MNIKKIFGFDLTSPIGEKFPIIDNISRFVSKENYASAFGLQWNTYRTTQLDSFTGIPISKDRLTRIAGGSLDIFRGKTVLEAGCGDGRFTEVLLQYGAKVFAVDISSDVDVNYKNCLKYLDYAIIQADIMNLPIPENQFDIVVCIGVIQHTPDPEKTIDALCSQLKPNGLLFIDHYSKLYPTTLIRKIFRYFLIKCKDKTSLKFIQICVRILWPLHKFLFKYRNVFGLSKIREIFLYWSPVVDYHDAYFSLGEELLYTWSILDTYDATTDFYKHLRSAEEIKEYLEKSGMNNIEITNAGNGIEARATKG